MKPEIQIGVRKIGPENPPFVIAEVGINHEGDFTKAIQMVDAAKAAGADCIKFQCHITEAEMIPTDMKPAPRTDEIPSNQITFSCSTSSKSISEPHNSSPS